MQQLKQLTLHHLHEELGARSAPFAGYAMPVQYDAGVLTEHMHTREQAGLFDVSHMGQFMLTGPDFDTVALALETLVPNDALSLPDARQRYGFFTDTGGGLLDDLMFARRRDNIYVVVNAARKAHDLALLTAALEPLGVTVTEQTDRALLALQGPKAEAVLASMDPTAASMKFMDVADLDLDGTTAWVSRSGYTGEDGYEISVLNDQAEALARKLLADPRVLPIGLGARDSLRLEAGLCLYGHDIDTTTTPVQANLLWAIQKTRRAEGQRAGGFPGAEAVFGEIKTQPERQRVGLLPEGRAPMREGVMLFLEELGGNPIGSITSGGFGPTVGHPIAMGYLPTASCVVGTRVWGELRGKRRPLHVAPLPFIPNNFKR